MDILISRYARYQVTIFVGLELKFNTLAEKFSSYMKISCFVCRLKRSASRTYTTWGSTRITQYAKYEG
jgi:hypothetical protein